MNSSLDQVLCRAVPRKDSMRLQKDSIGLQLDCLAGKGEGMLDAFECVGWGSLLIGADGRVAGLNAEAQRHVGSGIALSGGHISAIYRPANAELQRLIAAALSPDFGSSLITTKGVLLPRTDGHPLIAYAVPIIGPEDDGAERKAILVLLDSDKQREPAESILREAFGLTPAETRIAVDFARGRDLQEIAKYQALSIGTVRKHFKAILAKTNTSRQAELAILLARLSQSPQEKPAVPATRVRASARLPSSGFALSQNRSAAARRRIEIGRAHV